MVFISVQAERFYFSEEAENEGKLRIQIHLYLIGRVRPYLQMECRIDLQQELIGVDASNLDCSKLIKTENDNVS